MSASLRIAIITDEMDAFEDSSYLLNHLCAIWKEKGTGVEIIKGTRQELPPADIAILHTDITVVAEDYIRIINHYPKVINGAVTDISKKAFSDLLIGINDAYTGAVIVKTNANFGGMRELKKRRQEGDVSVNIKIQRPWRKVEWLDKYPIFDSPGKVPSGVWRNDNLVVEKLLTEQNDAGEYLLRVWVFLGDQEIYYFCVSNEPVIKNHNTIRRVFLDPNDLPESLRETRSKLGFDFGKFDFAIFDGTAVLYDVNRTPAAPQNVAAQAQVSEKIRILSTGFDYFIN